MIVTNCTEKELRKALSNTNKKYKGNVIFKRCDVLSSNRIRFTLRVKDSGGKGAKTGFSGRRSIAACWHVHGHLFEEILKIRQDAIIRPSGQKIDINGGNWQDRNIGSIMTPLMFSDACGCGKEIPYSTLHRDGTTTNNRTITPQEFINGRCAKHHKQFWGDCDCNKGKA